MLPVEPPVDEQGDPVVIPAVTRDVLDAIRRDLAESGGWAPYADLKLSWANDVLIVDDDDQAQEFVPGPDGLYEVGRLGPAGAPSQWVEVDPPLPDGPIDADTALDLLSRVRKRHPTQDLILGRLDLAGPPRRAGPRHRGGRPRRARRRDLRAHRRTDGHALPRLPAPAGARHLRRPRLRCRVLGDFVDLGREEILGAVPDVGERVLALLGAERDPEARAALAAALGRLGHAPAIPELVALLDDPDRRVRLQATRALGALRAVDDGGIAGHDQSSGS